MRYPIMNNTKWDELRLAMYALEPAPAWHTRSTNGHRYGPDREWFYHFREGGYADIHYVDIVADDAAHRENILAALKKIHVPGEETASGFRVFGWIDPGQDVSYL